MNSAALPQRRGYWAPALLLGGWAAAIAVAPTLSAKLLLLAPAILVPLAWWTVYRPARWIAAFFATALLLPPLPVEMGDSGPHICLVFALLGLIAGVLWLGEWRGPLSRPGVALAAFVAVLLASVAPAALYSGAPVALGSFVRVALFGISVYVFFFAAYGPEPGAGFVRTLYWIGVASALFACIDFSFQFPAPAGYGPQFVWLDSGVYRRAQGVFYEASTLGNLCAFFLVMIAVAFSRPRTDSPVSRKALAAGGAVFFAALVLSYSRGSLINVAVALGVLAWRNRARFRLARVAPLAAAAAFLTWKVFPSFAEMYWLRLSSSAEYFFSATEGVLSGRVASWRTLGAWLTAHPIQALAGIGYKTLPYTDYLGTPVIADNMYLSLLVETGVIGLALLVWLNVSILRAAGAAARSADPRKSFYGAWMLCFWAGQCVQMLSGDLLTYWRVLPLYFWVLALAVRQ
jgi:O-Antigen ligase